MLEKVESEHSTCLPLDLSTKSPKDPEISDMTVDEASTSPSSMSSNSSHVPKMNLLQLAGAVTYILEKILNPLMLFIAQVRRLPSRAIQTRVTLVVWMISPL